jgi:hypothetical protein
MAMPWPTPMHIVARPISTLGMQDHEVGPQRRDDRDRAVAVGLSTVRMAGLTEGRSLPA